MSDAYGSKENEAVLSADYGINSDDPAGATNYGTRGQDFLVAKDYAANEKSADAAGGGVYSINNSDAAVIGATGDGVANGISASDSSKITTGIAAIATVTDFGVNID